MHTQLKFNLPHGFDRDRFVHRLADQHTLREEPAITESRTYLDTFDWRLFNKSLVLYASGNRLNLFQLARDDLLHQEDIDTPPVFLRDFNKSPLKKHLAPVIKMRALLKLVKLYTRLTPYRVLNKNEKTVARLVYEEVRLSRNKNTPPLATCFRLKSIRGYLRYFHRLTRIFEESGLPIDNREDLFFRALEAVDKKPGSYTAKVKIELNPDMRSDEATRTVLKFLLQVIKVNQANLKKDFDTEILHDYRVAIRRTRSALGQVKHVFPNDITDRFKKDFAFVGKMSNELRDLDVYLLEKENYKALLPPTLRDDIDPLFEYLQNKRGVALKAVLRGLKSTKSAGILHDWEAFLNEPTPDSKAASNAELPVSELACRRIYKKYLGVVKTGRSILKNTEDKMLHSLRIECKKLRYLIEFFTRLFPPKKIDVLIRQLKKLQDNLGVFNDLCVQMEYLESIGQEFSTSDYRVRQTLVAIGALIGAMDQKRQMKKDAFAATFSNFASPKNQKRFESLFAPEAKS